MISTVRCNTLVIGIIIALGILGFVVAFLIPMQKQNTHEQSDTLRQQMEEQVRQLEQGSDPDEY